MKNISLNAHALGSMVQQPQKHACCLPKGLASSFFPLAKPGSDTVSHPT